MLPIKEVVPILFVDGREDTSSDFRKYANGSILVLNSHIFVVPVHPFICQDIINRVGINVSGSPLISSACKEIRIKFRVSHKVSRNAYQFFFDLNLGTYRSWNQAKNEKNSGIKYQSLLFHSNYVFCYLVLQSGTLFPP